MPQVSVSAVQDDDVRVVLIPLKSKVLFNIAFYISIHCNSKRAKLICKRDSLSNHSQLNIRVKQLSANNGM